MTLAEEIRALGETIQNIDLSETLDKIDTMEKIGASPMELLMTLVMALQTYRKQHPSEYAQLLPQIGKFSPHLEGKQKFVWEAIFTCVKPSDDE